jgi:hypothetical protein
MRDAAARHHWLRAASMYGFLVSDPDAQMSEKNSGERSN